MQEITDSAAMLPPAVAIEQLLVSAERLPRSMILIVLSVPNSLGKVRRRICGRCEHSVVTRRDPLAADYTIELRASRSRIIFVPAAQSPMHFAGHLLGCPDLTLVRVAAGVVHVGAWHDAFVPAAWSEMCQRRCAVNQAEVLQSYLV